MKTLPSLAFLFAVSASSSLAFADVVGGGSSDGCRDNPITYQPVIVEDAGTCDQPDAAGTRCGADAGTCGHARGPGDPNALQCLGPEKTEYITSCIGGCSLTPDSFHASRAAVPTFFFAVAGVALLVDRKRRRRTRA
jgi:hypothetical protein